MIIVDTHVIIWNALKPGLLSRNAKKAIDKANENEGILFCEISLWEIAMLIKKKKLVIDAAYIEFIKLLKASNNYIFKELTPEIAELSVNLPSEINQDPADRIICATTILNNSQLVTADKNLRNSKSVKTLW
ncbi:MAG: type II toxin-antitoxin system VapC family toxin [Ignavibacteriaceae bacterium]